MNQNNFKYTGIGSRVTPSDYQCLMRDIARVLAERGYILRSGGADGADTAFEKGCDDKNGKKEIYLPWKGFNGNKSKLFEQLPYAFELASQIHPAWDYLKMPVKKLMARNCHICLGGLLETPSEFIICWTRGGKTLGGTALAINLAKNNNIPIFNLAIEEDKKEFLQKVYEKYY